MATVLKPNFGERGQSNRDYARRAPARRRSWRRGVFEDRGEDRGEVGGLGAGQDDRNEELILAATEEPTTGEEPSLGLGLEPEPTETELSQVAPPRSTRSRQWAELLGRVFEHVALFEIAGSIARVTDVHGIDTSARGRRLSLTSQTPLRWALEAATPLVAAGGSPGGTILARGLGLKAPRAFAVVPLVVDGRLAAIAYADNGSEPLSLARVGQLFAVVHESLNGENTAAPAGRAAPIGNTPDGSDGGPHGQQGAFAGDGDELISQDLDAAFARTLGCDQAPAMPTGASPVVSPAAASEQNAIAESVSGDSEPTTANQLPGFGIADDSSVSQPSGHAERLPLPSLPEPFEALVTPGGVLPTRRGAGAAGDATATEVFTIPEVPASAPRKPLRRRAGAAKKAVTPGRLRRAAIAASLSAATCITVALLMLSPPLGEHGGPHSFRVRAGSSLGQIVAGLEDAGVIRSPLVFNVLARLSGFDRSLRAGSYKIEGGAWPWQVLATLQRGQVQTLEVTIPEGYNLKETARLIASVSEGVSEDSIIAAASDPELLLSFGITAPTAEGFLFPETYRFAQGLAAREIIRPMLSLFFTRLSVLPSGDEIGGDELLKAVTLASIIEREARSPDEMPIISGVFENRITRDMRLESCATVQYILGKSKERLLLSDLRIESPYNTYLNQGLPPGPIANPGSAALAAALAPSQHDYLFFLARGDGSHTHIFSETYAQHQKAKLQQKQSGQSPL